MDYITVWRITVEKYRDSAFSGEGAELYGGRFNSPGHPAVYTAATLSLALLELLVQVDDPKRLADYYCIPATFSSELVDSREIESLPTGWDHRPAGAVSQTIGDEWLHKGELPILRVPSVVVPIEYNYMLNPRHEKFVGVEIGQGMQVPFDPRLGR